MSKTRHIHFDDRGFATLQPTKRLNEHCDRPREQFAQPFEPRYQDAMSPASVKIDKTSGGHQPATIHLKVNEERRRQATNVVGQWVPSNYHRMFCAHDKARWAVCTASTCRRDTKEAAKNWELLMSGQLR